NQFSKELESIKRSLEQKDLTNAKINIKRDYKLTQKSNFDIWYDYLKSELTSHELLEVLESKSTNNTESPEPMLDKKKNLVRDIIINHIDEYYHKRILNITEPAEIIKKLKGQRRDETNVISASVRKNLYALKMQKNESVVDFCERFDAIVREYETCGSGEPLTAQELRSAFYQAVTPIIPQLRDADLIRRTNSNEMSLEEIKS
ncbi:GSCOCG00012445001-RA-CDS, partial [Cotesia congregata]